MADYGPSVVNDDEVMRALEKVFDRIDKWLAARDYVPEVQPGSRTASDDARTSPYQLSHGVETALSHSLDHLHALRTLVKDAGTIHMVAPFTLMRAALENAAVAAWMLMPSDADERVKRRLMLAMADVADGHRVRLLSEEHVEADDLARRRERIADIGVAAGLTRGDLMGAVKGYGAIVQEAGVASRRGAITTELMWRLCSGFTHGRTWSMLATLDRRTVGDQDEVRTIELTAPASAVFVVAGTAADMYLAAKDLHDRNRLSFRQHPRR